MTSYLIFRSMTNQLDYQGKVTANSAKKAVQTWLDQSRNPPEIKSIDWLNKSDYVAIAQSNINPYQVQRRR